MNKNNRQQEKIRKAAILISQLDQTAADALLAQFSIEQEQEIRKHLTQLQNVATDESDQVLSEFMQTTSPEPANSQQPKESANPVEFSDSLTRLLKEQQTEQTASEVNSIPNEKEKPFHFLHKAEVTDLAPLLRGEQPQTIAVVISHMQPNQAAELLDALPSELQVQTIKRLAKLDQMSPEILREVELGVKSWLNENGSYTSSRSSGIRAICDILKAANPATQLGIVQNLSKHGEHRLCQQVQPEGALLQPASHETLETYDNYNLRKNRHPTQPLIHQAPQSVEFPIMSFDEVEQLDEETLAMVIKRADPEITTLALAGASPQFIDRIISLLPNGASSALRTAIDTLGPTRLSDVETAQQKLAELATQIKAHNNPQHTAAEPKRFSVAA